MWDSSVPVPAPFCQEGGEVSVCRVEWDTVVPMPVVQGRLDLVRRDGGHNGPRRLRMVSLTWCVFVEGSVVYNSSRTPIWFGSDDHPAAPCDWVIDWNFLQDPKTDVPVKAFFDSRFPVEWNLTWRVDSNWSGIFVHKNTEWRRILHQVERLMFTTIKSAGLVPLQDISFEDWNIFRRWRAR